MTISGSRRTLACDREQTFLLLPSLDEWLSQDRFAGFVISAVDAKSSALGVSARADHLASDTNSCGPEGVATARARHHARLRGRRRNCNIVRRDSPKRSAGC